MLARSAAINYALIKRLHLLRLCKVIADINPSQRVEPRFQGLLLQNVADVSINFHFANAFKTLLHFIYAELWIHVCRFRDTAVLDLSATQGKNPV
jgi:hypothetical protein